MPAARKPKPTAAAGSDAAEPTEAAEPVSAKAAAPKAAAEPDPVDTDAGDGDEADDGEAVEVPLNRAARRAKGKGGGQSQAYGPGRVVGSKGPAHTQRMWSNRRSGG